MKHGIKVLAALTAVFLSASLPAGAEDGPRRCSEELIHSAVVRYRLGELRDAAKILLDARKAFPEDDAVQYYLGHVLAAAGRPDEAKDAFRSAISLDRGNYWYRAALAGMFMREGDGAAAAKVYEEALEDFPRKNELYYSLAELYMSAGRTADALTMIGKIETLFGTSEPVVLAKYNLLGMEGREDEAFEALEAFAEDSPTPQVLSLLAYRAVGRDGDLDRGLELYGEALSMDPSFPPALLGRAELLKSKGDVGGYFSSLESFVSSPSVDPSRKCDYLKSISQSTDFNFNRTWRAETDSLFNHCLVAHPSDSTVILSTAVYYYGSGRRAVSDSLFRKAMDLYPESGTATLYFIESLAYSSRWQELSSEARAAFRRRPAEKYFLERAILADYSLRRWDDIVSACDTMARMFPDRQSRLDAYTTMGDALHSAGRARKAYKAYEKALKIDRNHSAVLNNYAWFLCLEGRKMQKALQMSARCIEQTPDNATYLDTYGWILHLLGRDTEARTVFKRALLYGGKENPAVLDHYAEVLDSLGMRELALEYWRQALARNKGSVQGLEEKVRRKTEERKI